MVHLHASRRWMFNPMWKAAMSNQGRLMEFASLVYSPHRAEPPTRMPEPGASVFVSLSKRRTEPDSLRQFVSKATRLGSRVAFWRWRRIPPIPPCSVGYLGRSREWLRPRRFGRRAYRNHRTLFQLLGHSSRLRLPASRSPSLASPIITLAIAIVARSLRSINPSWPKAASNAADMLAMSSGPNE